MEKRTFRAFYGKDNNTQVTVTIASDGTVTPSEGITLPRNAVFTLVGDDNQVFGSFETRGGHIGLAHVDWSKAMAAKPEPRHSIIEVRINLEPMTAAASIVSDFFLFEFVIESILSGQACPRCGQVHDPAEQGHTPAELTAWVQEGIEYHRTNGLVDKLLELLDEPDEVIQGVGFKNRDAIARTMDRFNALLTWSSANTPQTAKPTDNSTDTNQPPPASTNTGEGVNPQA